MPIIRFAKNWNNKLNCDYFTTIRLGTQEKYSYYINNDGKIFTVMLKNKFYCNAKLIDIISTDLESIFNQGLNWTDAGLSKEDFYKLMKRFYGKKPECDDDPSMIDLLVLIFRKVEIRTKDNEIS